MATRVSRTTLHALVLSNPKLRASTKRIAVLFQTGAHPTATDTTSVSDSPARILAVYRTATDSTSATDSVVGTTGWMRQAEDTTSASDSVTHLLPAQFTGRMGAADSRLGNIALGSIGEASAVTTVADTTSASESIARLLAVSRSPSDTTSVSESISLQRAYYPTVSDTVSSSDSVGRLFGGARVVSDATSVSESISTDATQDFTRTPADTTSVSESPGRLLGASRAPSDSSSLSESPGRLFAPARTLSDSTSTSENVTRAYGSLRAASDTTSVSESVLAQFGVYSPIQEQASPVVGASDDFDRTGLGPLYSSWYDPDDGILDSGQLVAPAGLYAGYDWLGPASDSPLELGFDFWVTPDTGGYHAYELDGGGRYLYIDYIDTDGTWWLYPPSSSSVQLDVQPSTWYRCRCYVEPAADGGFLFKYWPVSDPEPALWQVVQTIPSAAYPSFTPGVYIDASASPDESRMDNIYWREFSIDDSLAQALAAIRRPKANTSLSEAPVHLAYQLPVILDDIPSGQLPGGLPPALVSIKIDGVEFGPDVDYRRSRFTTYANGNPGDCQIYIRDLDRTSSIATGHEVVVRFRGIRVWGGYARAVRREYVFQSGTGQSSQPRYLVVEGADYNILLKTRFYYNKTDPSKGKVRQWDNGTWDSVVVGQIVNHYLDLSGDGLSFDLQHVGTPVPSHESCNPDNPDFFRVGMAGDEWDAVMKTIANTTGAVYYIDPDKVFRFVDDSTKQSAFGWVGLSDNPNGTTTLGYREVEITSDATKMVNDQRVWGAGQGSASLVYARSTDTDSINDHGRWQQAEMRFDLYCQDTVDLRADTWLYGSPQNHRGGKDDRLIVRCTVFEPYFRVADVLAFHSTEFGINKNLPVRGAEITFPTPWDIRCNLTLGQEIDVPWSAYEFWWPRVDLQPIEQGDPGTWPPIDPCADYVPPVVSCDDSFDRVTSEGLGISDFGVGWGFNAPTKLSEDGAAAVFSGTQSLVGWDTQAAWMPGTPGSLNPSYPVEFEVDFRIDSNYDPASYTAYGGTIHWSVTDSTSPNLFMVRAGVSFSAKTGVLTLFLQGPNGEGSSWSPYNYAVDWDNNVPLKLRVQINESNAYARIWHTSAGDPGGWPVGIVYEPQPPFVYWMWSANNFPGTSYGAPADSFTYYMDHVSFISGLCGGGATGCADTFDRVESETWGAGPLGTWQTYNLATYFEENLSVDGDIGIYGLSAPGQDAGFIWINGATGTAPIEILCRVAVEAGWNTSNIEWALQMDGTPDPLGSSDWIYMFLDFVDVQGTYTSHSMSLDFSLYSSDGDYDAVSGLFTKAGIFEDNNARWDLWVRMRYEADGNIYVRLWEDGFSEPGTWTMQDTSGLMAGKTLPNVGQFLSPDGYDVDHYTIFETHSFEVTEGCLIAADPCADPLTAPPLEESDGTAVLGEELRRGNPASDGGTYYFTQYQFHPNSTEVWVNGIRIRLNTDYVEYPLYRQIKILSHINVGGSDSFNPSKPVRATYSVWVVNNKLPPELP